MCSLPQQKGTREVVLQRMPTEVIADRRRMFELFTRIKDQATKERDDHLDELVNLCINLWTKMVVAESDHASKVDDNVRRLQRDCDTMLSE